MGTAFAYSLPISSRTGAIMRQGPDQLAKKATRTETFESLTDSSKVASSTGVTGRLDIVS
jgi:hypothetical protein